ncbi:hypothetical protein HMI55_004096, partial [Coelomomyces lativittatus]
GITGDVKELIPNGEVGFCNTGFCNPVRGKDVNPWFEVKKLDVGFRNGVFIMGTDKTTWTLRLSPFIGTLMAFAPEVIRLDVDCLKKILFEMHTI